MLAFSPISIRVKWRAEEIISSGGESSSLMASRSSLIARKFAGPPWPRAPRRGSPPVAELASSRGGRIARHAEVATVTTWARRPMARAAESQLLELPAESLGLVLYQLPSVLLTYCGPALATAQKPRQKAREAAGALAGSRPRAAAPQTRRAGVPRPAAALARLAAAGRRAATAAARRAAPRAAAGARRAAACRRSACHGGRTA